MNKKFNFFTRRKIAGKMNRKRRDVWREGMGTLGEEQLLKNLNEFEFFFLFELYFFLSNNLLKKKKNLRLKTRGRKRKLEFF